MAESVSESQARAGLEEDVSFVPLLKVSMHLS